MFTGIVENSVRVVVATGDSSLRRITLPLDWTDLQLGESVAVNGVCLTVAELRGSAARFDVIRETLDKTNLGRVNAGDFVHVERSLRIGDRLDGHFVQGHVDGTAELLEIKRIGDDVRLRIALPPDLKKYFAPKGSIAIDGVSLTIADLRNGDFEVALIPTTLSLTKLADRPAGWPFNIECDMLAKSVVRFLETRPG